jgi:hypothetical protein
VVGGRHLWLLGLVVRFFDNVVDVEGLFEYPTAEFPTGPCWRRAQEGEGFHKTAFGVEGSTPLGIDLAGVVKEGQIVDGTDNDRLPFEGRTEPRGKEWGKERIAKGVVAECFIAPVSRVRRDKYCHTRPR